MPKPPFTTEKSPFPAVGAGGSHYRTRRANAAKCSTSRASQSEPCRDGAEPAPLGVADRLERFGPLAILLHRAGACVEARRQASASGWRTVEDALEGAAEARPEWIAWWSAREAFALGPRVARAYLSFLRSHTLSLAIERARLEAHTLSQAGAVRVCVGVELAERGRALSTLRRGPSAPSLSDVLELERYAEAFSVDRSGCAELAAAVAAAAHVTAASRVLGAGDHREGPAFADACAAAAYHCAVLLDANGPRTTGRALLRWRTTIPRAWRIDVDLEGREAVPLEGQRFDAADELGAALDLGELAASTPIGGGT